ncbi:DUF4019 domain-containing protein [Alkalimonas sp. NCh-2]|uniref:DUF4019 domain-containing protein n=1 Tax=Alkalimonas sp. NCh-2 TaxID=3144846 RepID=UPI0031F645E1
MRHYLIASCCLLFSSFCFAAADGKNTALNWLQLIDQGQYETSWQQAGTIVQQQLTETQWQQMVQKARQPFGALQSRTILSQQEHSSLPGAPDGRYLILTLQSQFEHKAAAIETLTLSFEQDEWRTVGYFIR